jgi:hypothetical protein
MHSGPYLVAAEVVSGSNALHNAYMTTVEEYGVIFSEKKI